MVGITIDTPSLSFPRTMGLFIPFLPGGFSTPPDGVGLSLHRQSPEALRLSQTWNRIVQHATDQQLPRPGKCGSTDEAQGQLWGLHGGRVDAHAVSTSIGHPDAVVRLIRHPKCWRMGKSRKRISEPMIFFNHELSWMSPTVVHHANWNSVSTNRTPNNMVKINCFRLVHKYTIWYLT